MKRLNKFLFIVLIIFVFLNFSAFNFNEVINNIGSNISNFINDQQKTENTKSQFNEEYIEIFDDLFNNIKTTLENADIESTQNYVVKDIKYRSNIKYVVDNYDNIKTITKLYFNKIQYEIKSLQVNTDNSIDINVNIKYPDTTMLFIKNIPSFISKNIASKLDLSDPSEEAVDELISIFNNSLNKEKVNLASQNFDFKIVKYNDTYKIENINNVIKKIEDSINTLSDLIDFS